MVAASIETLTVGQPKNDANLRNTSRAEAADAMKYGIWKKTAAKYDLELHRKQLTILLPKMEILQISVKLTKTPQIMKPTLVEKSENTDAYLRLCLPNVRVRFDQWRVVPIRRLTDVLSGMTRCNLVNY